MSDWKTHVLFGIVFVALFYFLFTHKQQLTLIDLKFFIYIPLLFFFVQLPDLDSEHSFIRRLLNIIGILMIIGFILLTLLLKNNIYILISTIILIILLLSYLLKHRGILHTILGAIVLSLPLLLISFILFFVGFCGYISHLILDGKISLY